jgi:hypothetical protein
MRDACDVLKGSPKSSATDPNFMSTYFRASRLHFIGTWKMRIEALMHKALREGSGRPCRGQQGSDAPITLFGGCGAKRGRSERCAAVCILYHLYLMFRSLEDRQGTSHTLEWLSAGVNTCNLLSGSG